jgi:hypothetical protein
MEGAARSGTAAATALLDEHITEVREGVGA